METNPVDLEVYFACQLSYIHEADDRKAYAAGIRTAINMAEFLVDHGVREFIKAHWLPLLDSENRSKTTIALVRELQFAIGGAGSDLDETIFSHPLYCRQSSFFYSGISGYGREILHAYRFYAGYFGEDLLEKNFKKYLSRLKGMTDLAYYEG